MAAAERLLDEVVAGDVDGVDAIHRRGDVAGGRRLGRSRARQRAAQASNAAGSANSVVRRPPRRRSQRRRQRPEADVKSTLLGVQQRRAGRRRARRRRVCGVGQAELGAHAVEPVPRRSARRRSASTPLAASTAGSSSSANSGSMRLAEPGQVPVRDARLVAVGVAAAVVDRAEHRRRVVTRP